MKKLILSIVLLGSICAFAQQDSSENAQVSVSESSSYSETTLQSLDQLPFWYNHELMASWAILFVGGIIMLVMIFAKPLRHWPWELHARLIVVTLAVVAALYLITAGWSSEQTAPAFGLLGAIVGYILGKGDNPDKGRANPPDAT